MRFVTVTAAAASDSLCKRSTRRCTKCPCFMRVLASLRWISGSTVVTSRCSMAARLCSAATAAPSDREAPKAIVSSTLASCLRSASELTAASAALPLGNTHLGCSARDTIV